MIVIPVAPSPRIAMMHISELKNMNMFSGNDTQDFVEKKYAA